MLQRLPRIGRVDLVKDGSAALRMVMQSDPDLVLLDIDLPADKIERPMEAQAAGADSVLLKDSPPEQLLAAIERLLPNSGT